MLAIILNRLRKGFFRFSSRHIIQLFFVISIQNIPVAKTITTKDMNSITPQQEFPLELRFSQQNVAFVLKNLR